MAKWEGPEYLRPAEPSEEIAYCRSRDCGMPIVWRKHPRTGKRHPVDIKGGTHFATCPAAAEFRGGGSG